MARALVQATLPHKKVEGNEFTRTNGSYTLSIMAPSKIGLPYGTIPRLLLAYVTREAVRTNSRVIELGESMAAFMRQLGLIRAGGPRGDITRLKDQTRRLFTSTVSLTYEGPGRMTDMGFRLADRIDMWWHAQDPEQDDQWHSTITLTEPFFREVVEGPVPIDMRALTALKRSPMALDTYIWLTYRYSYLTRPTAIPWSTLAAQFGADYSRERDFKAAFKDELHKVLTVYPDAQVEESSSGLVLKPSPPHVGKVR
ncbi:pirin [Azohydromonas sp. G-1-1-14]|uniref:Pirin n=2 Tax=Azohydromonas caseinilytica TaxID=2728836 RepID=A0A848FJK2_9BURK|nr:pirin [Azohydromonas caseinilytica]